ncbi:MAG: hypothetical protein NZ518_01740, partial [Dehalococcoidia bacterium]|nr:hypothetical protein [Dehalococcoidia bacterium]
MIEEDVFPRFAREPAEALERLPWAGSGGAIEGLRADLEAGAPWYPAVLRAIARWDRPDDVYNGRFYVYLI